MASQYKQRESYTRGCDSKGSRPLYRFTHSDPVVGSISGKPGGREIAISWANGGSQADLAQVQCAAALHRDGARHCHAGQRERPELLHCEAAAAPARQRLASPTDVYDLHRSTKATPAPQSYNLRHRPSGINTLNSRILAES